ncbi:MAG: putative ubiquinone biosynthesis monooxygenase [Candelina mexicana]|nr:MAG: putative ubiquinone biosynthesis monooxygenase [Candelina mexicana]
MQVWDGITGSHISFEWQFSGGDPQSGKQKTIAYMTENLNLSLALLTRLDELGLAAIYDKSKVESISLGEGEEDLDLTSWPVIEISGGRRLAARLLVGADGGNSPVRAFAGIESRGWDYERHGVVATVRLEGSGWGGNESRTAYQRFLPTGPVALLPLPGDLSTLVWSTTPTRAAHLLKLSLEDFAAMVNAAFRLSPVDLMFMHTQDQGQADEVAWREKHTRANPSLIPQRVMSIQAGSVASFPLRMRHADTYVGERITLIGDAAHTIHPLAGQGLNQGQGDVQKLVQTLGFAVEHGQDIGTQLSLESYNSERYSANNILIGVVDKLHKLYSASSGPLVPVRSWGLSAVNAMSPLKAFIMRHAAGYER